MSRSHSWDCPACGSHHQSEPLVGRWVECEGKRVYFVGEAWEPRLQQRLEADSNGLTKPANA